MYEEGYLGRENQIAKPTREKENLLPQPSTSSRGGAISA